MYNFVNKDMKSIVKKKITEMCILQSIVNCSPVSNTKAHFDVYALDPCCHLPYQIACTDARMQLLIYHHCQQNITRNLQRGGTPLTFPVGDLDFLLSFLFC